MMRGTLLRIILFVGAALTAFAEVSDSSADYAQDMAPHVDEVDQDHKNEQDGQTSAGGSGSQASVRAIQMLSIAACVYPIALKLSQKVNAGSEELDPEEEEESASNDLSSVYYNLSEESSPYNLNDKAFRDFEDISKKDGKNDDRMSDSYESEGEVATPQLPVAVRDDRTALRELKKSENERKARKTLLDVTSKYLLSEPYVPKIEQLYYHDGVLVNPLTFEVVSGTCNAKPWMKLAPGSELRPSAVPPAKRSHRAGLMRSMRRGKKKSKMKQYLGSDSGVTVSSFVRTARSPSSLKKSKLSANAAPFISKGF
jgi:hypothetical protein